MQLQIEFINRKQIQGDLHPGSLLGGLWKPHRRRSAVVFCPLCPVRTPTPPRELATCRAAPSWGSHRGQDMPRKGAWLRACRSFQHQDRAGLRAVYNTLSTPRGSRGPILKRRCTTQRQHAGPAQPQASFPPLASGCRNVKPNERK